MGSYTLTIIITRRGGCVGIRIFSFLNSEENFTPKETNILQPWANVGPVE